MILISFLNISLYDPEISMVIYSKSKSGLFKL